MPMFRQKLTFSSSLNSILIIQLIILKLSFASVINSDNKNKSVASSLSELDLEFSDSIPGFEQHEFQSLRIKPLSADKFSTNNNNNSTITKVTTSATLAAALLKKVGLPSTASNSSSNKTILNSVLIKRTNRPTTANLISSNLITTTPISSSLDKTSIFKRQINKALPQRKLTRLSKKKKAKQSSYKSLNSSTSQLSLFLPSTTPVTTDIQDNNNELTYSSIAPSAQQATEQHSVHINHVMINHGDGAISTIRRTLNSGAQPSFEHHQMQAYPRLANNFQNDPFPNFNLDFTPPPLPHPMNQPSQPALQPKQKILDVQRPPLKIMQQPPSITKPPVILSSNRNGRLRGAHKKQVHINRRKSAALVKDNELNNQIVPVSVGIPNSFQNVKPSEMPNFAELSFFGYQSDQDAPRTFNEREHYTNSNQNNFDKTLYHHENNHFNNPPIVTQPNNDQPPNSLPRLNSPSNNFNLHPFFSNEQRNQPNNNNGLYQFFDSPFMPINPPNIQNLPHNFHTDNHQINHHQTIFHQPPLDNNEIGGNNNGHLINHPVNTNGQFFQRRKLTLSNGNTAPAINEISNNNIGFGPSYSLYKGDEENPVGSGMNWPKIFKFVDGRVNLNDFEKEKKLGKIEFGKGIAEDGNEYTFEHVRRDLFLILHGGSFNYK